MHKRENLFLGAKHEGKIDVGGGEVDPDIAD